MTVPGSVWPEPVGALVSSPGRDGLDPLRQAEVEDLDVAVSRDEEVLGLQVPVDDALLVGGGEAPGDLERVVHGLLLGDRAGVELPAQRLALPEAP